MLMSMSVHLSLECSFGVWCLMFIGESKMNPIRTRQNMRAWSDSAFGSTVDPFLDRPHEGREISCKRPHTLPQAYHDWSDVFHAFHVFG